MGTKYLKLLLQVFVHSKHFIKGKKYAFVLFPSINYLLCFANMIIAAAAKSLQSCPTLCDPIDGSPPGSAVPAILQARALEWVAISFSSMIVRFTLLCKNLRIGLPWSVG